MVCLFGEDNGDGSDDNTWNEEVIGDGECAVVFTNQYFTSPVNKTPKMASSVWVVSLCLSTAIL